MNKPKKSANTPQLDPELEKYRGKSIWVLGTYPLKEMPAILRYIWEKPAPSPHKPGE